MGMLAWELKTVNHRFLELSCRLPEEFRSAGVRIPGKNRSPPFGAPGKSRLFAAFQARGDGSLAGSRRRAARQLDLAQRRQIAAQAGAAARIDVLDLLRWPGVMRDAHARERAPMIAAAQGLLTDALAELSSLPRKRRRTPARRAGAALRGFAGVLGAGYRPASGDSNAHAREAARPHRTAGDECGCGSAGAGTRHPGAAPGRRWRRSIACVAM